MKLTCPACGAQCSLEAWSQDASARQALKEIAELPGDVGRCAPSYMALFRPSSGRSLRWDKVARLLAELRVLVSEAKISWDNKPARPNRPAAWARAMERIVERPPRHLPLKSHGYLTSMAYEIANEYDQADERRKIKTEQTGTYGGSQRAARAKKEGKHISEMGVDFSELRQKIKGGAR